MLEKITSKIPTFFNSTKGLFHINPEILNKTLASLFIILILWLLRKIIFKLASRYFESMKSKYHLKKSIRYGSFFLGILLISRVWFEGIESISTIIGLVSAGIAVALREPLVNIAGWIFILWQTPFEAGDRIQIGATSGDVIDQKLFHFTLMEIGNWVDNDQSTGRVCHIPNGKIFQDHLFNYSKGFDFIWNEIDIVVTFESNWVKAKEILTHIINEVSLNLSEEAAKGVKKAAANYMIFFNKLTPIVYTDIEANGVKLTMRYLCKPKKRRSSINNILEEVLNAFLASDDIDFAYPTTRLVNNPLEGKKI
jgi:small-conductance mechanosensitive channel